ncbi:hypothetical protein WDZ92_53420, partial [Nostoc sp. NIES-2111]
INFQVRINDSATLEEIGLRVGKALNLTFNPSQADEFEGDEVLETEVFGLWITLSYWTDLPEEKTRNYRLVADVTEDINMPWGEGTINISQYILGVLVRRDHPGWYIPDIKEILAEAGIE